MTIQSAILAVKFQRITRFRARATNGYARIAGSLIAKANDHGD
jgi:hypothetical protein